ncbi:hypothetical protein GCM10009678_56230 [Actinomadura kijaniata]|uniref:2-methylisocitrate lyase-like PEP mutase family enzyme n=1 Tax=Actinomadura namibiensis TaxID=182080 RepID=A0A7W3QNF9_ACTNM|nr:hypothetical protein [Actinomadura namibiensis]MBA8952993.1 2-methylisocitrate lyase-like PEP mutase family enzyme [Actinomadura namibiensis]
MSGTEEQVIERLRSFVDAGARHVLLRLAALDADDRFEQLERLAFLPQVAGGTGRWGAVPERQVTWWLLPASGPTSARRGSR